MLLVASLLLVAGYTLLYAGVRGIHWRQPWLLVVNARPPAPTPMGGAGAVGRGAAVAA